MITQDSSSHRHVIPRWLGYRRSLELNELGSSPVKEVSLASTDSFRSEIDLFRTERSHRHGADLFERLILNDSTDLARELAPHLVDDRRLATPLRDLAKRTLDTRIPLLAEPTHDELIRVHRDYLRDQPRNGIRWVELARLYTIKREYPKAHRALRTALGLNPRDRYTVRSLIRFLLHIQEIKDAANVLGSNINSVSDPWLKGVGLSALMIAGKSPKTKFLGGPEHVDPTKFFENSEFLAACGMLQLENGKDRSAKEYFKTAWIEPSGNVTTHAEWLTRTLLPKLRPEALTLQRKTPEALAGEAFSRGAWAEMSDAVQEWILEEPYSNKPYRFLAQACNLRGEFGDAIKWLDKVELCGTCDFGTKISRVYALLMLKQFEAAEKILGGFDAEKLEDYEKVHTLANLGLFLIQKGSVDEGLSLYRRAEREAATFSHELAAKVFLNAAVSSALAGRALKEEDRKRLSDLAETFKQDISVGMLLDRIDPTLSRFEPSRGGQVA